MRMHRRPSFIHGNTGLRLEEDLAMRGRGAGRGSVRCDKLHHGRCHFGRGGARVGFGQHDCLQEPLPKVEETSCIVLTVVSWDWGRGLEG